MSKGSCEWHGLNAVAYVETEGNGYGRDDN